MKIKHAHILTREVLPFLASLLALGAVALLFDALLHLFNAVWVVCCSLWGRSAIRFVSAG